MLRILADQLDPSPLLSSLFQSLIETDSPPIQFGLPPDQTVIGSIPPVTGSTPSQVAQFYCRTHRVLEHLILVES